MKEQIGTGVFEIKKASRSGTSVLLVGKLTNGSLSTGWKAKVGNKIAEIINISLFSSTGNTALTIKGINPEDLGNQKVVEFKTMILEKQESSISN